MEFHLPATSFVLCFSIGKLLGQVLIALRILQSLVKGSELLRVPLFYNAALFSTEKEKFEMIFL